SASGLVGGGAIPAPGEATLAHHGVLFLDELSEFARPALEALRQPLEDGQVIVVRGQRASRFPTRFTLVAATNPCPCGFLGSGEGAALREAHERSGLSARGRQRVLRVARTVADLDGAARVAPDHVLRALSLRQHEPGDAPDSRVGARAAA